MRTHPTQYKHHANLIQILTWLIHKTLKERARPSLSERGPLAGRSSCFFFFSGSVQSFNKPWGQKNGNFAYSSRFEAAGHYSPTRCLKCKHLGCGGAKKVPDILEFKIMHTPSQFPSSFQLYCRRPAPRSLSERYSGVTPDGYSGWLARKTLSLRNVFQGTQRKATSIAPRQCSRLNATDWCSRVQRKHVE